MAVLKSLKLRGRSLELYILNSICRKYCGKSNDLDIVISVKIGLSAAKPPNIKRGTFNDYNSESQDIV